MPNLNFARRTEQFWNWFIENEEALSAVALNPMPSDGDAEKLIGLVNEGLGMIAEDVKFNIGGDHEFTFTVSGNYELFFLLPYVTANLPAQFRNKWKFYPCMPGTNGRSFGFRMLGLDAEIVDSDDVMVSAAKDAGGNSATVRFWAKGWAKVDDRDCLNAFYILMEILIGEALSAYCVEGIERADSLAEDMFPLTKLQKWLLDNICENGEAPDPADMHSAYEMEPQNINEEPRSDVFVGTANYMPLIDDYLDKSDNAYNTFAAFGARPMFLYFDYPANDEARQAAFDKRNQIMDMIEEKILGERGSGKEIGVLLGGAMGIYRAYIDLLLYDEQLFIEKARELLKDEPMAILCKEFIHGGNEIPLFGHDDSI